MPPRGKTGNGTGAGAGPGSNKLALRSVRSIDAGYAEALLAYADVLYKGGLGGKDGNRKEVVAAKIEVGRDIGLPPTQAISNVMILNGRATIWGDAGMALIRSSGLMESCSESFEGDPEYDENRRPTNHEFAAVFRIKRHGSEERIQRFSVGDAIRAGLWDKKNTPWQTYPERQMMWRAKSWACRDEFQDVLCGCMFFEEGIDIPGVRVDEPIHVINVEVNTPSVKITSPETQTQTVQDRPTESTPTPTSTPTLPAIPITTEQLVRLAELRGLEMNSRSITDDDAFREVWLELLKPFGVDTARNLTSAQATVLIQSLATKHDFPTAVPAGQGANIAATSSPANAAA